MKFWKQTLLTALLFFTFVGAILYTACEKASCTNVTCLNGGSCNSQGKCNCPTGYENSQCQDLSIARYVGVYAGITYCTNNHVPNTQGVIDSAYVLADNRGINTVKVIQITRRTDTMHGYVTYNQSSYLIIVPKDSVLNDVRTTSITLENDNELTIQTYETVITRTDTTTGVLPDTTIYNCNFYQSYKIKSF